VSKNKGKNFSPKFAHRHHFNPQFYLAGFTVSGSKDECLWALDKKEFKQWKDKPKNLAFQTDFYRIEAPGVNPDEMEKALGKFENKIAPIVNKIIDLEALPVDKDFTMLIIWIALMVFRTPRFRRVYEKPLENIGKLVLKMMTATPEIWNNIQESMKKNGYTSKKKASYEDVKRFVESDYYTIEITKEFSREFHTQLLIKFVEEIMPSLISREWSIAFVRDKSNEFICSDNPVLLRWTKPMPKFDNPGFERENTEVIMPLNKNIALLGRFEGKSQRLWVSRKQVATINRLLAIHAQRFIYSSRKNFLWLNKDGNIGNIIDLKEELKRINHKKLYKDLGE